MSTTATTGRTVSAESEPEAPRPLKLDAWELAVVAGVGLVALGGWMAWAPAGPIILGLSLTGFGIMGTVARARREAAKRAEAAREERRGIPG